LLKIQKFKDFNGNRYLQAVRHVAPYGDHLGLLFDWFNAYIMLIFKLIVKNKQHQWSMLFIVRICFIISRSINKYNKKK
jgi:hypothetical protein